MACRECESRIGMTDADLCRFAMISMNEAVTAIGGIKQPTMLHETVLVLIQQARRLTNEIVPPGRGNQG